MYQSGQHQPPAGFAGSERPDGPADPREHGGAGTSVGSSVPEGGSGGFPGGGDPGGIRPGGSAGSGAGTGGFAGTSDALAAMEAALAFLARADAASLTVAEQAACLRGLTRVESAHTAAQARVLTAFTAQAGYELDGHGGPRAWLVWQARITRGAAAGALGWARRRG